MESQAPTADAPSRAGASSRLTAWHKVASVLALLALAAVLLVTFRAYLTPAMLFDFATLQICG